MKKIGLLLGSFDPIHIAHVNVASSVINGGLCDKVLFVVAKHNPWKKNAPADFDLRCRMIEASIAPWGDRCEVCRLEEDIEPPTYSYKVIEKLREQHPEDELFLICGTDTVERLPQWKKYETNIKPYVGVIEVKRGDGMEIDNKSLPFKIHEGSRCELTNKGFWYIKTQRIDASSTLVRRMLHDGMNPLPYVTKEALEIIKENNLYR
jgi:nicotinate-nucleotide adenylyltransferase